MVLLPLQRTGRHLRAPSGHRRSDPVGRTRTVTTAADMNRVLLEGWCELSAVPLAHQDADVVAEYRRRAWWGDATVGDAVARWAAHKPDDIAFIDDDGRTTWSEYDRL